MNKTEVGNNLEYSAKLMFKRILEEYEDYLNYYNKLGNLDEVDYVQSKIDEIKNSERYKEVNAL